MQLFFCCCGGDGSSVRVWLIENNSVEDGGGERRVERTSECLFRIGSGG